MWRLTASLLTVAVAASVGAALFGWAARGAPAPPPRTTMPVTTTEPLPAGAQPIVSAPFSGLDGSASGIATLLRTPDALVLRLEPLTTDADPGDVLYLVPAPGARTPAAGVVLGPLHAANGAQNYVIPVGVRLDGPLTVLIWSRTDKAPVAHAALLPGPTG